MENLNYKNENIERELEKDFIELKDREIKNKKEIEELFF